MTVQKLGAYLLTLVSYRDTGLAGLYYTPQGKLLAEVAGSVMTRSNLSPCRGFFSATILSIITTRMEVAA